MRGFFRAALLRYRVSFPRSLESNHWAFGVKGFSWAVLEPLDSRFPFAS